MGGMFGMKAGVLELSNTRVTAIVKDVIERKYPEVQSIPVCCADDQDVLTEYIWQTVTHETLSHDVNIKRC